MKSVARISLLILHLIGPLAFGQVTEPAPGDPIDQVEVVGNKSVAPDTIRVYLGLNPGDPYDPAAIRRNFLNLWQTGLFDDIKIEAEKTAQGVLVRVTVSERPRIGAVEFRGNKNLNLTKINEALDRGSINLHVGSTIEQTLVKRAAETIREAYAEAGFEGVTVTTTSEEMVDPNDRRIIFNITEGIKAKIADIEFVGNETFSDRRLRREMKEVKEHNLITWARKKNVYIPSKLDEDLERVRNFYLDRGYKDITFGDAQIETTRKERVRITIPINEGAVHQFGKVTVAGNTVFTEEQLIGNWPTQSGETLSRKPVQARLELFEEAYQRRGYIYAYINSQYVENQEGIVDVHLQVFEGDQFRL
ncbi:MAG TPA: POTRA domain-containing protein, partial [Thermoanaerobaculia bacterium]|nr:POTRA domain-containing protein [Thermoanaerobaculia bacterium]